MRNGIRAKRTDTSLFGVAENKQAKRLCWAPGKMPPFRLVAKHLPLSALECRYG